MKLKVTELKKSLKTYDQKELIQLVADLFKQSKDVQTYLTVKFLGEEAVEELFSQTKKKIEDEFFPDKGYGKIRLAVAKKAINDFKKITNDEMKTIDLMIFYVENGVEFTNAYGDINENFYNSMENMYEKVIMECNESDEYNKAFAERLEDIVIATDGIGWGFHDGLAYLFSQLEDLID